MILDTNALSAIAEGEPAAVQQFARDVTEETSARYAEIRLELKRAGTPIPANDAWIAALARQHTLPILSRDDHFDFVSGVNRLGW